MSLQAMEPMSRRCADAFVHGRDCDWDFRISLRHALALRASASGCWASALGAVPIVRARLSGASPVSLIAQCSCSKMGSCSR